MFLHSGASLHGHEYSNRSLSTPPVHGLRSSQPPLLRSALAPSKPRGHSRQRATSTSLTYKSPHIVRFRDLVDGDANGEDSETDVSRSSPMSEDEASFSASESDASTSIKKRRRRAPQKSSTILLAHPAPKLGATKGLIRHIRPQLLLQLQILREGKRPEPAIDVFPASLIAGPVVASRFAKKFPGIFGAKAELGIHDVVLLKYDEQIFNDVLKGFDSNPEPVDDDLEHGALVAVLSPLRREDRAEIVLEDGSVWSAAPWGAGSYEFVHVDIHGNQTTARWVLRNTAKPAVNSEPGAPAGTGTSRSQTGPELDCRFTFSLINPLSRRHPVMATLTPSTLEVLDSYTTISTSSGRYPPSRRMRRSPTLSATGSPATGTSSPITSAPGTPYPYSDDESAMALSPLSTSAGLESERVTLPVDIATKRLIGVTAVWVALHQGWSPYYRAPGRHEVVSPQSPSAGFAPSRSSTSPSVYQSQARRCLPVQKQDDGLDNKRDGSTDRSGKQIQASNGETPQPRRATSSGAAFMQRRAQLQATESGDHGKHPSRQGRRVVSGDWQFVSPVRPMSEAFESAFEVMPTVSIDRDNGVPLAIDRDNGAPLAPKSPYEEESAETPKAAKTGRWKGFGGWFRKLRT